MDERTEPDADTQEAEQSEAASEHLADRDPTDAESEAADRSLEGSDSETRRKVAENSRHMNEIGANTRGEGRVTPS